MSPFRQAQSVIGCSVSRTTGNLGYFSWCQARGDLVALLSFLETSINTLSISWDTNPLRKHQRCPKIQMLSLGILSANAQAEESSFLNIFSGKMENNGVDVAHYRFPELFSFFSLVCSSSVEELKSSPLQWSSASLASLQHCLGCLVNTGNANPLNTSLLCLEDCHDKWIHPELHPNAAPLTKSRQL